ncbi:putative RHO GTPase-activating protein RGD1 [Glarea lozoyensis 74030]|uniref:Putative RHO GTPase-activating protein RGD1 n=1 Tax=Glarea lozoyensis (strain ATCC 74030 / MF5533) TaxID=1104152 RepID=H0EVD9_GLAL7|nr:putative RHO GTPase-activating protein RGD1 [Glarea lozoyensis 74030]
MFEDLNEMAANIEKGRKHWKTTGLATEARAADAETAMRKSKAKYDALAEDYDRARTGDGQSGKKFGLKGPKSAQQHEADLLRKLQAADADYQAKVTAAQGLRSELLAKHRPDAVKSLQELIKECDSALTLQMQKYASGSEKLLLSNGLTLSPLNGEQKKGRSLREVIHSIDNEKDLSNYLGSFANKVGRQNMEIKYERHPVLNPSGQSAPAPPRQGDPSTFGSRQGPPPSSFPIASQPAAPAHQSHASQPFNQSPATGPQQHERSFSQGPSQYGSMGGPPRGQGGPSSNYNTGSIITDLGWWGKFVWRSSTSAVDLFGLDVEGIYRLSGTASHISKIKAMFDNDASSVDFRNPENFYHDVNSVAGLLKQFFRDLPDPLLTVEHYAGFIEAAIRRDSLHAIINSLPDPNYATLRALTLHLNRVCEHSNANRMNASNIAIVFGPTLMGASSGPNIQDAGWQVRVYGSGGWDGE